MRRTLLLPCAGKSSRYPGVRPKWMLTLPDGELALARAAASLPTDAYERIVVAVRAEHDAKYQASALLHRVFGPRVEILVLAQDTAGPADTVARCRWGLRHQGCGQFLRCRAAARFQFRRPQRHPHRAAHVQCRSQELRGDQRE